MIAAYVWLRKLKVQVQSFLFINADKQQQVNVKRAWTTIMEMDFSNM